MKELELIEKKIQEYEEKRIALIQDYEENYGAEYDDGGDILDRIFWRDIDYINRIIGNLEILKRVLESSDTGSKHNFNKGIEQIIHNAREVKKDMKADIQKAQEVISEMDEIISVCEKHRK